MTINALLRQDDEPGDDTAARAVPRTPQAAREEVPAQPAALPPGHALTTEGGDRMSVLDQVIAVIRHGFRQGRRQARDMSSREGGWVNAGLNGRLPSVNGQRDYLANRRWLPPGHEEGIADRVGEAFYAGIGVPAIAAVNLTGWMLMRLYHFLVVLGVILAAVFLFTSLAAGLPAASLVTAALFSAVTGYLVLTGLLLAARRACGKWRAERSSQPASH